MIVIRFDEECLEYKRSDDHFNELLLMHIIQYFDHPYKKINSLNDIYDKLGKERTIDGFKHIFCGPISMLYMKDIESGYFVVKVLSEEYEEDKDE